MATVMTHAFVGASLVLCNKRTLPKELLKPLAFIAAVVAMVPDIDVLAFGVGIAYEAPFGHRGFTHSLSFAVLTAIFATGYLRARSGVFFHAEKMGYLVSAVLLFASVASHPLLDMLTDGGLGCAIFAPISWERLFFPLTPIPVSPIGLHQSVMIVWAWEIALVWPISFALLTQGLKWEKLLKALVLFLGISGTVAAVWVRQRYYGPS